MRYLSLDEVWRLHLRVAQQARRLGKPFSPAIRDRGLLEAAVNQPRHRSGGADLYLSVFEKAAVLARGIICGHVFVDANKRTGLAAARLFLEYNNWEFDLPDDDLVTLALDIVGDKSKGVDPVSVQEIAGRLASASKRLAQP